MADMPIYDKNTSKHSSAGSVDRFPRNLVCSIWGSDPSKYIRIMTLGRSCGMVKFCNLGFSIGQSENSEFLAHVRCDLIVYLYSGVRCPSIRCPFTFSNLFNLVHKRLHLNTNHSFIHILRLKQQWFSWRGSFMNQ